MVPKERFELSRPCGPQLLRLVCLPFHHFGIWHCGQVYHSTTTAGLQYLFVNE